MIDDSESESVETYASGDDEISQASSHRSDHSFLGTQPVLSKASKVIDVYKTDTGIMIREEDENKAVEIRSSTKKISKLKLLKNKSKLGAKQDIQSDSKAAFTDPTRKEGKSEILEYDLTYDDVNHNASATSKSNKETDKIRTQCPRSSSVDTLISTPSVDDTTHSGVKRKLKTNPKNPEKDLPPSNIENLGTPSAAKKSKTKSAVPTTVESNLTSSVSKSPKKKKKMTFQMQVLSHILTNLKPFTLKSLAAELKTTDVALHNLMLSLVDKGVVRRKEVGNKTKKEIYWIDLEKAMKEFYGNDAPSEKSHVIASAELKQSMMKEQEMQRIVSGMSTELTNEEIIAQLQHTNDEVSHLKKRLEDIKARIEGQAATVGVKKTVIGGKNNNIMKKPLTKVQVKTNINSMRMEWKSRKEKCVDFVENLADAMERKPKDIYKLLDIETDEMVGVKLPPKQKIHD